MSGRQHTTSWSVAGEAAHIVLQIKGDYRRSKPSNGFMRQPNKSEQSPARLNMRVIKLVSCYGVRRASMNGHQDMMIL